MSIRCFSAWITIAAFKRAQKQSAHWTHAFPRPWAKTAVGHWCVVTHEETADVGTARLDHKLLENRDCWGSWVKHSSSLVYQRQCHSSIMGIALPRIMHTNQPTYRLRRHLDGNDGFRGEPTDLQQICREIMQSVPTVTFLIGCPSGTFGQKRGGKLTYSVSISHINASYL